jgi:hypothetical protein
MAKPWVIVGGTGYDVEEVDRPQTRDMLCPACEKHVRFVEKQLVKNLRVFGVPLVGLEKGRRVFECPRCGVCVEPPEGEAPSPARDAAVAALETQLARAEDEQWLWRERADLATRKGEETLAAEALRLAERAERELARLKAELARARAAAAVAPREAPRPAVVARPGAEGVQPSTEDEFAALKRRLAQRSAEASGTAPTPSSPAETAPAAAPVEPSVEDEFAALKQRLAARGTPADVANAAGDEASYAALKRELSRPAAEAPVPPPGAVGEDDDPVAALKRKLKKPRE